MPQLPSGRHVAIDPQPLILLMKEAAHFGNIHKVMAIDGLVKLYEWLDVVYLVTPQDADETKEKLELADSSLSPPPGFFVLAAGRRVSHWEELARDWCEDDRIAMRSFLSSDRFLDFSQHHLDGIEVQKRKFHTEGDLLTQVLAGWNAAGIHPLQEDRSGDASRRWDTYDMLAALGDVSQHMSGNPLVYKLKADVFDRVTGVWQMMQENYEFLAGPASIESNVRATAESWRKAGYLEALSDEKQKWLYDQMIIECVMLCDNASGVLEKCCPKAYAIFTLVALGPKGDAIRNAIK